MSSDASNHSLGLDVGAAATKAVLLNPDGVLARAVRKSGAHFASAASACLEETTAASGIRLENIQSIVATGYGRRNVDFATTAITEITCHARGCYETFPHAITIVDIGGQDNKVISVTDTGDRRNFKMNRKCAAGTGAFIEEIAGRLDTPIEQLDNLARSATGNLELGSFCTVFAKTELLSLIAHGTPLPEIVKAAFRSVVKRIIEMDPLAGRMVMTGGVIAHNTSIVDLVTEAIGREVLVPKHPQFTGAYGAALLGLES